MGLALWLPQSELNPYLQQFLGGMYRFKLEKSEKKLTTKSWHDKAGNSNLVNVV